MGRINTGNPFGAGTAENTTFAKLQASKIQAPKKDQIPSTKPSGESHNLRELLQTGLLNAEGRMQNEEGTIRLRARLRRGKGQWKKTIEIIGTIGTFGTVKKIRK